MIFVFLHIHKIPIYNMIKTISFEIVESSKLPLFIKNGLIS